MIEWTEEADLTFLKRLCNDAGLCLKVTDMKIVIFEEKKLEDMEPVDTIIRGVSDIKSYSSSSTLSGMYKACRVEYHNANKNEKIKFEYKPPNAPKTGRVLVVNERVTSIKEAEALAKKRLRQENKNAVKFSLTLAGDTRYLAGVTVNLRGFGYFDGKYLITRASHSQQGGYETQLDLRKCLEGY